MSRDRPVKSSYSEQELQLILRDQRNLEQVYATTHRLLNLVWNDAMNMASLFNEMIQEERSIMVPVTRQQLGLTNIEIGRAHV